ncbi:MAG: TlpA family protein disulfide reductase [Bacteroidia bacterium]|nr:TlpA family protein disulfide reductase [Bacteroidia bacterium]MBT8310490.1 TlpA family protein disulfide reductase [Bacteroidia bacterium]NNK28532.1 TlpA family protein disulfide reductase [Flavobacteriaceae bacterium]NNL60160.1 TlpA family protein disulfide reductase [Flavobacteriaceae bacterium]
MKKAGILLFLFSFLYGCSFETPTSFPEEVLNDTMLQLDGSEIQFRDILRKHEGKKIVIDVWASWCKDCIVGFPKLKALQQEFPNTDFVFLSVDRNPAAWQRSLTRYDLKGDHYFIPDGQKGVFGDFMNSNWIPRYLVIDAQGNIELFKAKKADDKNLKEVLIN